MSDLKKITSVEISSVSDTCFTLKIRAVVDDMVMTVPATYMAGIAEPAQFGPAQCFKEITFEACHIDDLQSDWEIEQ